MAPNKLFNSKSELHVNTVNNNSEKSDCLPGKVTHDLLLNSYERNERSEMRGKFMREAYKIQDTRYKKLYLESTFKFTTE